MIVQINGQKYNSKIINIYIYYSDISSDMAFIRGNNTLESIKWLVTIIIITLWLNVQWTLTDLDAPIIHICDPPKWEFYVLLRHYFMDMMHLRRTLPLDFECITKFIGVLLLKIMLTEQK